MEKYTFNNLSVNNNINYLYAIHLTAIQLFYHRHTVHRYFLVTSELTGSHDRKKKCFICITDLSKPGFFYLLLDVWKDTSTTSQKKKSVEEVAPVTYLRLDTDRQHNQTKDTW